MDKDALTEVVMDKDDYCYSSRGSSHEDIDEEEKLLPGNQGATASTFDDITEGQLWCELEQELQKKPDEEEAAAVKEIIEEENELVVDVAECSNTSTSSGNSDGHRFYPPGRIMHIVSVHSEEAADSNSSSYDQVEERVCLYETHRELYSKLRLSKSMAAKKQQVDKTKERKRIPGSNAEADKSSPSKVPKLAASKSSFPPKIKASGKPSKFIKKGKNVTGSKEKKPLATARERRLQAKELAQARKKKRKRHYPLEQELARLWEKMRRRDIAKEDKAKLVTEALQKMKGKIPEIAGSHVSSRVLQTCVKHCSQAERDAVFEELSPHFITLSYNAYAVHLVKKMLDHASKKQLAGFISSLHGHVAPLLRHMVGSVVVEHAYELATAAQKQALLLELCSTELQLFKDLVSSKEGRLVDVISKLGLQKGSVLRHMTSVIQPILEKGIADHSIIHRLLTEYLSIADQSSVRDIMEQLSGPLLVRMIGTGDGAKLGILCVKHGSAKERKKIIKGMKGHIDKIAYHKYGCMVLVCIISVVDDSKLITKAIISELQRILKDLVLDKIGWCVLLQLLHPNCSRYFSPEDLASLNSCVPSLVKDRSEASTKNETSKVEEPCDKEPEEDMEVTADEVDKDKTSKVEEHSEKEAEEDMEDGANKDKTSGKKDAILRRQDLLIKSGLAESLIDICIENAGELIQSNFGKYVGLGTFHPFFYKSLDVGLLWFHRRDFIL